MPRTPPCGCLADIRLGAFSPRCKTVQVAADDREYAARSERHAERTVADAGTADVVVRAVLGLVEGEHVHLDELLAAPPAPGSSEWLSLLRDVIDALAMQGGIWFVTMPIGFAALPPKIADLDVDAAIRQAAEFSRACQDAELYRLAEPPAVYRGHTAAQPQRWSGVSHSRQRLLSSAVHETIAYSKDEDAIALDEAYSVSVTWQIRSAASGA